MSFAIFISNIVTFVLGIIVGIISKIGSFEYENWRKNKIKKKEEKRIFYENLNSKCNEFKDLWEKDYKQNHVLLINPYITELRNKFSELSQNFLFMKNEHIDGINSRFSELIEEIGLELKKLSRYTLQMDGGISLNEFNQMGELINKKIRELQELIK